MSDSNRQKTDKTFIQPDLLAACIHCGLCLPACPTYLATGRETESPRGRIYLLNEWNSGNQPLSARLVEHIDSCLGCLGCQTACPSGVLYEDILNQARPHLTSKHNLIGRQALRLLLRYLLPNYPLLRLMGSYLRFCQQAKPAKLTKLTIDRKHDSFADTDAFGKNAKQTSASLFSTLAKKLQRWWQFLPTLPAYKPLPTKSFLAGKKEGVVQLFSGCVMDVFYNQVNHAAMRLLAQQSRICENAPQTCCGALAFHAGEIDITIELAKQNIMLFEQTDGDIVVTAAGCGAMLKEYGKLFAKEAKWQERASVFANRVKDITETLAEGQFRTSSIRQALPQKIAYHAACHLVHAQKVSSQPESLLKRYASDANQLLTASQGHQEVELLPLQEAEHCCGSAGIYNLLRPDMALAVLRRKLDFIEQTGANLVVTTNPGCLLQLEAGVKDRGIPVQIKHLCEVLDQFYCY